MSGHALLVSNITEARGFAAIHKQGFPIANTSPLRTSDFRVMPEPIYRQNVSFRQEVRVTDLSIAWFFSSIYCLSNNFKLITF